MMRTQPTDEDLVVELRAGQTAAFDRLYARYERRLYGYIRRFVADRDAAEDLFQDVFLTVVRDRSYQPDKGRFSAWLFTVARNRCLMELRKHESRKAKHHLVETPARCTADPAHALEQSDRVHAAMAELSEPQRQLLVLKQVGELTYQEIAAMLGIAEGTIKSRLHTAMKRFRRRLAEFGEG